MPMPTGENDQHDILKSLGQTDLQRGVHETICTRDIDEAGIIVSVVILGFFIQGI